ncbi:MAG: nuclear transport factor 2 family protein [Saprospiraceae bacterium]|nr:nuclear transport factor 2 family protein [Saprospiraceae bacterium]MBK8669818.1 nuclear transport factor 2 family protein [Saprospiraceae bacterium]
MKFLYVVMLFISSWTIHAQTDISNIDELIKIKIHHLHLKKFQWFTTQQFDSLATLLHDDVHYIHSNGWKESKSEVVENIKSGKLTYTDVKVHESDVRLVDKTAVVTGKGTFYVSMDGKAYEFNLFYTEVYIIRDTGIQLLSRHACKY